MPDRHSKPCRPASTVGATRSSQRLAGLHLQALAVAAHAAGEHAHHGAGEAAVGDHDVRAAGEHEQRLVGGAHELGELALRARLDHPRRLGRRAAAS